MNESDVDELAGFRQAIKEGKLWHTCSKCDGRGCSGPESNGMYECLDCGGKGVRKIILPKEKLNEQA